MVEELLGLIERGHDVEPETDRGGRGGARRPASSRPTCSATPSGATAASTIAPRTPNQKRYVDSIRDHTVTFGIGPAGTGKTFLAVAMAVAALECRDVSRLILTRPAVEAGERLGFLPGDIQAKVDPYLRPLFDALYDMLDPDRVNEYFERGIIEVAPLAFMRGRTLNDSFVILDEAQNTSPEQMKMFLTRLGFGSKMVVTGDITQIDLPANQRSGLVVVGEILSAVEDIDVRPLRRRRRRPPPARAADRRRLRRVRRTRKRARPRGRRRLSTDLGDVPAELRDAVAASLAAAGIADGHLSVELVGEERIRELNLAHRGRDRPTDVLSFPIDGPGASAGPRELGDVMICPPQTDDLVEAAVHGVLHLCGYDHETDDGEMLALQGRILARLREDGWERWLRASRSARLGSRRPTMSCADTSGCSRRRDRGRPHGTRTGPGWR